MKRKMRIVFCGLSFFAVIGFSAMGLPTGDCWVAASENTEVLVEKTREISPKARYLLIPVTKNGPKTFVRVEVDSVLVQEFTVQLADSADDIAFFGTLDVSSWPEKCIRLVAEQVRATCEGLNLVRESDELGDARVAYTEKYRPQFHFSPRRGWTNDPNGLHWFDGVYHLFYQHNPFSTEWGNMTWGHATSPDLIHWTEHTDALMPDRLGTIFSGSGIVDSENTSGLAPAGSDLVPQVVFYTSHGPEARPETLVTQSMAYSLDGGQTWTKYAQNPVVQHIIGANRDPKVFWHAPTQRWVMALYLDGEDYALLGSANLTAWEELCRIERLGCSECPDMFELSIDGDASNKTWVFWGGDGAYLLGDFDGHNFIKKSGPFRSKHGGNDYAAQTFSDLPDGRRVQFSWMAGGSYPNMPFNQQFSLPRELSLRTTPDGVRLAFWPVKELDLLRGEKISEISPAQKRQESRLVLDGIPELFDVEMTLDVSAVARVRLEFSGTAIEYDVAAEKINGLAPLAPKEGKIRLRLVADRMSWELFAADGVTQLATCFVPSDEALAAGQANNGRFVITSDAENETLGLESLNLWPLQSIWK